MKSVKFYVQVCKMGVWVKLMYLVCAYHPIPSYTILCHLVAFCTILIPFSRLAGGQLAGAPGVGLAVAQHLSAFDASMGAALWPRPETMQLGHSAAAPWGETGENMMGIQPQYKCIYNYIYIYI